MKSLFVIHVALGDIIFLIIIGGCIISIIGIISFAVVYDKIKKIKDKFKRKKDKKWNSEKTE